MRPSLSRISSSESVGSYVCHHTVLRRAGLSPLKPQPFLRPARSPRVSSVQAVRGEHLFAAVQTQVRSLAESLGFASPGKAVQAALLATVQYLQRLVRQIWLAAAALDATTRIAEQAASAAAAAAETEEASAAALAQPLPSPLELVAAATSGAVERLRHTLCDASCSLETKWGALEATVGSTMSSLFHATSKSAQALNSLGAEAAEPAPSRAWQEQAAKEVVQHEEQLYQQVFVQVYGELLSKDNRQISYSSV